MEIKKIFGKQVKKFRLEKGLSQEALAHQADLDRTYIPSIEKGERNVSITVIEKIAKALKIKIVDLLLLPIQLCTTIPGEKCTT